MDAAKSLKDQLRDDMDDVLEKQAMLDKHFNQEVAPAPFAEALNYKLYSKEKPGFWSKIRATLRRTLGYRPLRPIASDVPADKQPI